MHLTQFSIQTMALKHILYSIFFGLLTTSTPAQEKKLTIEKIWSGEFQAQRLQSIKSMKNSKQYTVLELDYRNRRSVVKKQNYLDDLGEEIVVESNSEMEIPFFTTYTFSKDESRILLASQVESIYRRSTKAIYHIYHLENQTVVKVSDHKIQSPLLSPDGNQIAYGYQRNLFIKDLITNQIIQITDDGDHQTINGLTDWVYEEEFGFVRAFDWSFDSRYIAYLKFDESEVPEYSMDFYLGNLYPSQYQFRYPKAGENNSIVSVFLYDLKTQQLQQIPINDAELEYIARIKFDQWKNKIYLQTLNRHQNHLKLWTYHVDSQSVNLLHQEKDKAYVSVQDQMEFFENGNFLWTSEKDGYNHIYYYDHKGDFIRQITRGNWDVTDLLKYNKKEKEIYYQSVETTSIGRAIYAIDLDGQSKRLLSPKKGFNGATFNAQGDYFIHSYSDSETPPIYQLVRSSDRKVIRRLLNNQPLIEKLNDYNLPKKEFQTININGYQLNSYLIKPINFDPNKKYPVVVYQYSGPGSQQVSNRWMNSNDLWHLLLTQKDYIVACVDPRGTGYKGRDFKKLTYMNLVKYETEDQISFGRYLSQLPYVDSDRIGIWGWSFGGHVSSQSLLLGHDVFSLAIAVAPVTSWRFYDTIYTERFMRTPQENPEGYDRNAPLNHVEKLKGDYLIIHGSGDDNVHLQNTMEMASKLIQANKPFDMMIYPDKNHGIYGGHTRNHLFTKMTQFITTNL